MVKLETHPAQPSNFDWGYVYYAARTIVGMTEEEFWDSSIEVINDLVEVHGAMSDEKLAKKRKRKFNSNGPRANGKAREVFIDQIGYL